MKKLYLVLSVIAILAIVAVTISNRNLSNPFIPKLGSKAILKVKYFNLDNAKILALGKSLNWKDKTNISFLPIYANAIFESQTQIPIEINEKFPEIYDFIAGYSSTHNGELNIGQSYFKKLQSQPTSATLSNIGILEKYIYIKDITSLCNEVKNYKHLGSFSDQYANELLIDFELACLVDSGEYEKARNVIRAYKPNDINDQYKKNIILINILNLTGKYQESKQLIDETKIVYGVTDALILEEANLYALRDGFKVATEFLGTKLINQSFLLNQKYAMFLANSNVSKSSEAIKILVSTVNDRPFDIDAKLTLAHYSFDYGYKKQLDDSYASLVNIKDIESFSSFNLLEAKMALIKKNYSETDSKLNQTEAKNPHGKQYL